MRHIRIKQTKFLFYQNSFFHFIDLHPGNILVDHHCSKCQELTTFIKTKNNDKSQFYVSKKDIKKIHQYAKLNNQIPIKIITGTNIIPSHIIHKNVKLILLDAGLVTELNRHDRENFLSLFGSLVRFQL